MSGKNYRFQFSLGLTVLKYYLHLGISKYESTNFIQGLFIRFF